MQTATTTTTTTAKKLHLNMKFHKQLPTQGSLRKYLYDLQAKRAIKSLGLEEATIKHHNSSHIEIMVTGEKEKLWEMVKWSKKAPLFCKVKEISFQFIDISLA
jgi:acylphosphatase